MLKPLTEAIDAWAPREGCGRSSDPLVLLAAGWSEIVGAEVARNSRPTRIADGMLVVTTRSSAWSQQLSYLSERIVAAVRGRLPSAAIDRLMFRIGRLTPHAAPSPAPPHLSQPAQSRGRSRAARPPAASAEEAIARFRQDVGERQRAKRAAGWKECGGCGALIAPSGALCVQCRNARARERGDAVARLLFEAPWLGYAGTAALVDGLKLREYEAIRKRLLARWWETLARARAAKSLSRDGRERLIASSYVLLESRLAPEEILPATVRNVLGDELHDLIYGTGQQTKTNVE